MEIKNRSATVVHTVNRGSSAVVPAKSPDQSAVINGQLQRKLLRAVSHSEQKPVAIELIVGTMREAIAPASLIYLDRDASNLLNLPSDCELLERLPPGAADQLRTWADETCQAGAVRINQLSGAHQWSVVTVPVMLRERPPEVLCAISKQGETPDERVASALQLGASHITLWYIFREAKQAKTESKNSSALLELLSDLDNSEDLTSACYLLVNDLRDYLGCSRIALGLTKKNEVDCHLTAVSGLSDFDARSEFTQQIEAALNEAVLRDQVTVLDSDEETSCEGALAHEQLFHNHTGRVVSAPLHSGRDEVVGAWVFLEDKRVEEESETVRFVRASQMLVGSRLSMLRRAQVHPLMRPIRSILDGTFSRKITLILLTIALVIAVLLIPVNYRIGCQCQLEPVSRRFVAAPYDGTLMRSLVQPGELVTSGQVLAQMDARELRWELSGLEADYKSEMKKRDAASARDEVALAQQSRLEAERLQLKMELLQHRLDNLEVKSPIAGVVISGDLKKSEGAPLTIGQSMFEIGPLEDMIVEVAIPERDILYVQEGMPVEFRLDAAQDEVLHGTIARFFPRSETREDESVYVAEVYLANRDGIYRPGMKGTAKVISDPHALGWNLFHKAWESLAMMIGF